MLIGTPHPTARNILFKHLEESNKVENISFVFFYTTIVCSTLSTAFSTRNRICNYIYIILINNFSSVSAVNAKTHTDGSRFFSPFTVLVFAISFHWTWWRLLLYFVSSVGAFLIIPPFYDFLFVCFCSTSLLSIVFLLLSAYFVLNILTTII